MVIMVGPDTRRSKSQQFGEAFGNLARDVPAHMLQKEAETNKFQQELIMEQAKAEAKEMAKYNRQKQMLEELFPQGFGKGKERKTEYGEKISSPQPSEMETALPEEIQVNLDNLHTDDEILAATLINPQLGQQMRNQNESMKSEMRHAEEMNLKERKYQEQLDFQSFRDNKDYIEKVLGGFEAYKRDQSVLNQMANIAEKGQLPTPMLMNAMQKVGLPIGILDNPDAEQFEKLSQELMKNIQGTYGSRILQTEVQNFMKSIPQLINSPEGQKRLISQWKILNEGKKAYYDAYKDLRKTYSKRLPPDLHEQVIEKAEPILDQLAQRFYYLSSIPTTYEKPPGKFLVADPEGNLGEIDAMKLDEAIQSGYQYVY